MRPPSKKFPGLKFVRPRALVLRSTPRDIPRVRRSATFPRRVYGRWLRRETAGDPECAQCVSADLRPGNVARSKPRRLAEVRLGLGVARWFRRPATQAAACAAPPPRPECEPI